MKRGFFDFFVELPPLAKTIITVALIAAVIVVILWIKKTIQEAGDKAKKDKAFNDDYNNFIQQGQTPTLPATNYILFADKIYEAGCKNIFCYGTDEDAIYDVFEQMKNDVDILLLIKAFGVRDERGTICIPFTECIGLGLGQWLQAELSSSEFEEINNILTKKGIQFKF